MVMRMSNLFLRTLREDMRPGLEPRRRIERAHADERARSREHVEVRVDDGEWRRATLGTEAGVDCWRQWFLPWDATPGRHDLTVRATDGDGELQTQQEATPFPAGATGWHSVAVTVTD